MYVCTHTHTHTHTKLTYFGHSNKNVEYSNLKITKI